MDFNVESICTSLFAEIKTFVAERMCKQEVFPTACVCRKPFQVFIFCCSALTIASMLWDVSKLVLDPRFEIFCSWCQRNCCDCYNVVDFDGWLWMSRFSIQGIEFNQNFGFGPKILQFWRYCILMQQQPQMSKTFYNGYWIKFENEFYSYKASKNTNPWKLLNFSRFPKKIAFFLISEKTIL